MNPIKALKKLAEDLEKTVHSELSKQTNLELTEQNYEDWLNGGATFDVFDAAVKQFLGEDAYNEMDSLARLDAFLQYKLGIGPQEAGGISFN